MGEDADAAGWPLELRGVTEAVVTTRGPNDRWNLAALGLFAGDPVTARTWGRTRTQASALASTGSSSSRTEHAASTKSTASRVNWT